MRRICRTRGASATEYAVLIALLGVIIIGAVFATGIGVRDVFETADGRWSSAQRPPEAVGSQPVASVPVASDPVASEPREGDPLVMTFSGTPSFEIYRYRDASNFPNPRIDWGPGGEACPTTFRIIPDEEGELSDGLNHPEWYSDVYTCPLGSGTHTVRVYAPVDILTNISNTLVSVDAWGDTDIVSLQDAFSRTFSLTSLPATLPGSVVSLHGTFKRYFTSYSAPGPGFAFLHPAPPIPAVVGNWNVSNVQRMSYLFAGQPANAIPVITNWNVSGAQTFRGMFAQSTFNQDISGWRPMSLTDTGQMFWINPAFNQNLNGWDMSTVWYTESMFAHASAFNGAIDEWDVGAMRIAQSMFLNAGVFNQPIGGWDTKSLEYAERMFEGTAAFTQDLSEWNVRNLRQGAQMFKNSKVTGNYGKWRPYPGMAAMAMWSEMFRGATGVTGDLRCWDASLRTNTTAPMNFSTGAAGISHQPLWGQPVPTTCTP